MKFRDDGIIDYKTLVTCLLKLGAMVVLARVSMGIGLSVFLFLAFYAMVCNRADNLFFVVLMIIAMTMGSSALIPKNVVSFTVMRGTLMLISVPLVVKIAGRTAPRVIAPLMAIMWYMVYIAGASITGWCPVISELKVLLFAMIFLAFYGSATMVMQDGRVSMSKVRAMMLSIVCFFLIGSVLSIPFPAVSMMNAEEMLKNPDLTSLFRGITNHSQCLGPCCAMLGTIVLGDLLFGVGRSSKLHYLLLVCAPILIYKTASRTAMGSMLLGVMVVLFFFMRMRHVSRGWRAKIVNVAIVIGLLGSVAIVATPSVRKSATAFINKRGDLEGPVNIEQVIAARGGKAEECMENFRRSPLVGNGFQVSWDMQDLDTSKFTSLLSAPIEKGFIWAAILEEGGVIGFGLFCIFALSVIVRLAHRGAYIGCSTFIVFLVTNTGEFTFFSMTYSGGLFWACVFMGLVLDDFRMRKAEEDRMARYRMQSMGWRRV